jgi:hypothetical protein
MEQDIVERLRAEMKSYCSSCDRKTEDNPDGCLCPSVLEDAAKEIERLREELKRAG